MYAKRESLVTGVVTVSVLCSVGLASAVSFDVLHERKTERIRNEKSDFFKAGIFSKIIY